ncbi:hypothetical protein K7H91_20720 [Martelella mediterranea]|uniref:hypothetical protein n=1 Tax=Martelella mediterranea TaxID=293089 RepID=UPI001E54111C|nr:hypothetical protein [Martelella mediterranea]MCD1636187.1 hypothetical protein [Martelella mediterranea]
MNKSNDDKVHGAVGRGADVSAPNWTPVTTVTEMGTPFSPSCARFNGTDWAVWRASSDGYVWYNTDNGSGWGMEIGYDVSTNASPAITVYDGKLYLFWSAIGGGRINYATHDGFGWTTGPGYHLSGTDTYYGPAAASWNGKLYVAWNSYTDNTLSYSWFDGKNWYKPRKTSYSLRDRPALGVFDNTLYGAIATLSAPGLVPLRYANSEWVNAGSVPGAQNYYGPALASDGQKLLLMWADYPSGNLMTSTLADADSPTWTPAAGTASGMKTRNDSPALCGDSTGFRAVWTPYGHSNLVTSTLASSQPTPPPPPPTTDRPVPPEIDNADQNNVSGVTGYNYYVTIIVTSSEGDQLTNVQTQAKSNGSWAYTLDYTLTQGMTVQAVTSKDKDSTASDAYVKVIGQFQTGPLRITSVETDQVSGVAPDTGQVIKAWRLSDGALMVLYPVPAASPTSDGKTFTAPYVRDMKLAAGDLLCVVSQFPKDGTMTPFNRQYEGYPGS